MNDKDGSPDRPLKVAGYAIGSESPERSYLSLSLSDGRSFYFALEFDLTRNVLAELAHVIARWPKGSIKNS